MAQKTAIAWTEATWNPWHGCKKVSPGCKFCYMYSDKERYGLDPTVVVRSKQKAFNQPLTMDGHRMIFTCSWSDFFIEEADEWRPEAWAIIKACKRHTFQILTKRTDRIMQCLPPDWGEHGYENVWLGASIENQDQDCRIADLLRVPARVRFVSVEPLLEAISLRRLATPDSAAVYDALTGTFSGNDAGGGPRIHWVIVGGESGNEKGQYRYRPCNIEWIEAIVAECKEADVPVFVKQFGTHLAKQMRLPGAGHVPDHMTELYPQDFPL